MNIWRNFFGIKLRVKLRWNYIFIANHLIPFKTDSISVRDIISSLWLWMTTAATSKDKEYRWGKIPSIFNLCIIALHLCGPGQIPASTPYVGRVYCWFSPLHRKVFLRVLRFSRLLKNQHFQIPIRSGKVDEEPLCGCASSKSLFI